MALVYLSDLRLNVHIDGPERNLNGPTPALVLIHGLGLDASIWDQCLKSWPNLRVLRFDLRGHGGSDRPDAPAKMGQFIHDTQRVIEHFNLKDAVVIGHGLGGMIAQGLAIKRLDLVRALVLVNSAAKIGAPWAWTKHIETATTKGMSAIADYLLPRWFNLRTADPDIIATARRLIEANSPQDWANSASALMGSDFYETTAKLRLSALAIAGHEDKDIPPDLQRETADLIPGHRFQLMQRAGHLPMLEQPTEFSQTINDFLTAIGHC